MREKQGDYMSSHRMGLILTLIFATVAGTGCGKKLEDIIGKNPDANAPADFNESANAASEQLIAVAQNFDPGAYAQLQKPYLRSHESPVRELIMPSVWAAVPCNSSGSTVTSCVGSGPYTITRTYNNCALGSSSLLLAGTATYTFSAAGCSMIGVTNRSVTRTTSLTLTGKTGGTLTISSGNHTDYRGNTVGGGQKLTVGGTSGQYTVDVLGMNRTMNGGFGSTIFNISSRTTSAITATGTSLSNLVLTGGTLEIIHNRAQYVLTLALSNVAFSNTCACPVSGSLTGTYSGSVSGSATFTFTGCGTATVASGDVSRSVSIDACAYP